MTLCQKVNVHIRWLIRRDMPDVLHIEAESYRSPWNEEDILRCMRQRNCTGMVAEHREKVVGFMVYELHKKRLHILNLAVHPSWRHKGIGTQMVAKLASKLAVSRRERLTLEVRETNLGAQLFFRSQGFEAVNVIRGLYEDTGEDAYRMVYRLKEQVTNADEAN